LPINLRFREGRLDERNDFCRDGCEKRLQIISKEQQYV
jgi:hypothetical protein